MPTSRLSGNCVIVPIKITQRVILIGTIICLLFIGSSSPAVAGDDDPDSWLYLRGGRALTADEDPVELIAAGDILLGRSIRPNTQTLATVAPLLQTADLAIGNFEGVIAPPGRDAAALSTTLPGEPYKLIMPPQAGELLHAAGFDLLSLANNHALDLGAQGLQRSVANLQSAGMDVFGVLPTPGALPDPVFVDVGGLRLAFLGFTLIPPPSPTPGGPVPARYDPAQAAAAVASAHQQADAVIVMLHWGFEYQVAAAASQQRAAQVLIGAGADLVLGAHPHVVQGTQVFGGLPPSRHCEASFAEAISPCNDALHDAFVAYSLGNFVFDQYQGETANGLALRILLDASGLRAVQALPLRAGARPAPLDAAHAQPLLARLQPPTQSLAFSCDRESCSPVAEAPESAATRVNALADAPFRAGEIDLTGDGLPETIRLVAGRVEIWQSGELAWSSPPEWKALDLALGDPNDDGRHELLVSLRKPDAAGVSRSHPFIVGYRRGMYKLLWGGSTLSTPITEVDLGDVDGDGAQELVVLEEQPGGARRLSVWRWHGWGFTLFWRSPPGRYQDLSLVQDPGRERIITVNVKK